MDIDKAEKLLKRYLEGTCTTEERQLVESWYEKTLLQREKMPDLYQESLADTVLRERLKDYMLHQQVSKRSRNRLPIWAAVAMLLLVFSALYIYNSQTIESSLDDIELQVQNDRATESDGVTLRLAGGETIELRSDQGIVIDTSSLMYSDGSRIFAEKISREVSPILELNTPKGGQYKIDLADGSRVWLNASSSLKFPKEFIGTERIVELVGEAYFEVSPDEKRPFKVVSNFSSETGQVIEVLGTKFNVNAYKEGNSIKTTLLEGSVKVNNGVSETSKILKPRQQSIIRPNVNLIETKEVNVDNVMAWRRGDFVFDDEDLESIMQKVARWYDINVHYERGHKPRGLYFKGVISQSRDLVVVLQALEETGRVEFKINGRDVTVKQAGNN